MDLDNMDKVMELCGMRLWEGEKKTSLKRTGQSRQYRSVRLVRRNDNIDISPSHKPLPCLLCSAMIDPVGPY